MDPVVGPDSFEERGGRVRLELRDMKSRTASTVDVERLTVEAPAIGLETTFPLDAAIQERFLEGLDDIGLTERHGDAITSFEGSRPAWLPASS